MEIGSEREMGMIEQACGTDAALSRRDFDTLFIFMAL